MISFLSIETTGRKTGIVVTSLIAAILSNVCEATCPRASPLKIAKPLRFLAIISLKRNIKRRWIVIK